jgi:hypothetical protein
MKITEHIHKRGKFYPDKPFDPYNRYPYESVKEVRDWYGDFVASTEGYTYFIVWINSIPSNRCKVVLFIDKEDISRYRSNYDVHPSEESTDWLHYSNSTDYLPINGRSAEELNNFIAKILMDFYNKRIYEYIEKNKPKTSQVTTNTPQTSSVRTQTNQLSANIQTETSEKKIPCNSTSSKKRMEIRMELIRRLREMNRSGIDPAFSNLEDVDK